MADTKSKPVELRVTARHHTHKGKTYKVGDDFMGTDVLLEKFGDRLELTSVAKAREKAEREAMEPAAEQPKEETPKAPPPPAPPTKK